MKRTLALILAAVIVAAFASFLCAAKDPVVYVTIANGELVLAREAVTLTDADNDGALTINDALYLAHEAKFEGGAAAGYGSAKGDYGLSLTKLWGVENGGSYGYFVNDNSAMSLADPLSDGDEVVAFIYTTADWSDAYSFFDVKSGKSGAELTFYVCSYDENWALVKTPTAGAEITVDGVKTGVKTDANGKAKVELEENGEHIISAVLEGAVIVPPVCTLKKSATPATGDSGVIVLAVIGAMALAGFAAAKKAK
jgi:LPXTG-motif cell wall-anchored protein